MIQGIIAGVRNCIKTPVNYKKAKAIPQEEEKKKAILFSGTGYRGF